MTENVSNLLDRICLHPGEAPFVLSVVRSPRDLQLLDEYASWLIQHGDPRGEYVRIIHTAQIEYEKQGSVSPQTRQREQSLADQMDELWLAVFGKPVSGNVTATTNSAIHVQLGENVEGEAHISDMSF